MVNLVEFIKSRNFRFLYQQIPLIWASHVVNSQLNICLNAKDLCFDFNTRSCKMLISYSRSHLKILHQTCSFNLSELSSHAYLEPTFLTLGCYWIVRKLLNYDCFKLFKTFKVGIKIRVDKSWCHFEEQSYTITTTIVPDTTCSNNLEHIC